MNTQSIIMLGFVLMEQKNSRVEPTKQRDQTTNVRSNPVNSLEDKAAQQVPVDSALENKRIFEVYSG